MACYCRKFVAQHRPLKLEMTLPTSTLPSFTSELALGAAYWKSPTAERRTLDIIELMDADDPVVFDPVRDYASLENALNVGTKRTPRHSYNCPWEKFVDPASRALLHHLRSSVDDLESLYENLETDAVFRQLALERIALERLTTRLMREVLEMKVSNSAALAQDHTLAWKVFSEMKRAPSSVPIPPSSLVDHFERVMAPKDSPATAILPSLPVVYGPLTKEESELCDPFSATELRQAVDLINMDSAPGPDGYPPKMVKGLFSFGAFFSYFLMFVNFCFQACWIPLSWCCSEIFVLAKGTGDPTSGDSYRGIALCSLFAKLYERLLLFRVTAWWKKSRLFKLSQFGFRSGSSTLDAVFVLRSLLNFVCRTQKLPLHACFIDLRKAFPSVSRTSLFCRLINLGVPYPLVMAVSSFYKLNLTRLRIGKFLSRPFVVTLGLLEGSILSPLLFSIVFSMVWEVICPSAFPWCGVPFKIDDVWILAYADDLVILSPSRIKLASVLSLLEERFAEYNLSINLNKTEIMTFFPRGCRHDPQSTITLRGHSLSQVSRFNYLGVLLSDTSSLTLHVDLILQRAKISLHKTVELLQQLQIHDLSRLRCYFTSLIQSQLYGLELIPHSQSFISRFDGLRNLFVRRLFGLPQGAPSELFYILFPSLHPALLCLQRRHAFFKRALRHDLKEVPLSFLFDASLLPRSCGWFFESFELYRYFCPLVAVREFDFARDIPALLELTRDEYLYAFSFIRASSGSCMSFFRLVRHPLLCRKPNWSGHEAG